MNDHAFALDVWHASQSGPVQRFASRLWGTHDGAADGISEAVLTVLSREGAYDAARGTLATWLIQKLKSIRQSERQRGHRRGTAAAPRVVYPGDAAMPTAADLCDPESILIARELNVDALEAEAAAQRARAKLTTRKLTAADVAFIRSSSLSGKALAQRFGVAYETVSRVRRGKSHKGV